MATEAETQVSGIPSTMLAAECHEFRQPYKIHDVPTPRTLKPHDILIRVAVASFCHTDYMVWQGEFEPKPSGKSGSHEPTGVVEACGSAASTSGFKKGDRVAAIGFRGLCEKCADCLGPEENRHYCKFQEGFLGTTLPGAFQDYTIVDARYTVVLPDSVSFRTAAPLTCAGATSWRAVMATKAAKGEWIGLIGSGGGLGHLAIQFAKAQGLNVLGVDARDEGLALSKKAGADLVLDARLGSEKLVEAVKAATGGVLMKASVVLSDHPTAADTTCDVTADHGTIIQVAQPPRVGVFFRNIIFKDIHIQGSLLAGRRELGDLIQCVVDNKIRVETRVFEGLRSLPTILEETEANMTAGKMVIVVDKDAVADDEKHGRW